MNCPECEAIKAEGLGNKCRFHRFAKTNIRQEFDKEWDSIVKEKKATT